MFSPEAIKKFNTKWSVDLDGCWIWHGSLNQNGYGQARIDRRIYLAHRLSYMIHKGEIPEGMNVCHECDVRLCVNPEHLWIGSQSENLRDMVKKKRRGYIGKENPCSKVTEEQVLEVRRLVELGIKQSTISRMLGIPYTTVSAIKLRRSWKHL